MSYKVLLIEDDPSIRQVISAALEIEGYVVHQFSDGESAVAEIAQVEPDVAIIDLRLPGINGLEVVRTIRPMTYAPLVILTAFGDSHDVVAALEAGADDFLSKPIANKELAARIRAILRRNRPPLNENPDTSDFQYENLVLSPLRREASIDGELIELTNTEFLVLLELMRISPNAATRQDLLEKVWGYDYLGDSRLIDMQIYRLRGKLAQHGLKDHLITVRGHGFKLAK
ncbi:MAG: response regulator transcription factor [Actinobacteria bacterium]|nr:response regulator transcription factor [Actinomycetota bacterium]MDA2952228.1 response regulator transcription factor [Actinomycetota bacterium]MDA2999483.1 response regulator transcription factor [Actinomycetota bacterium]